MRKAQWIALLATVFVAVFGAGTARADWQTDRAQAMAAKLWNDPCSGQVKLWPTSPPQPSWRAWTYPKLCTIALSNTRPWQWNELCPVMLHEYGHLAGYTDPANPKDPSHSHDPDDIMWPFEHYDVRCDDYGSAFLGVPRPPEAPAPAPVPVAKVTQPAASAAATRRKAARIRRQVRREQKRAAQAKRRKRTAARAAARRGSAVRGAVRALELSA
jgi:hypothetical protein